jgi:F-type H+-transporting ATPase subunit b
MEMLGEFGINPVLLAAQIVNFLIIFYIVKRFALKPILEMLNKREKTIKDGLQQAEEARALLDKATEKERVLLRKAQTEAKELLADAKREREEMLAQNEERTRVQTEKMLQDAKMQIAAETKEAEKRLSAQVSALAVQFLQKSAEQLFTDKEQKLVLDNALKKLKKVD